MRNTARATAPYGTSSGGMSNRASCCKGCVKHPHVRTRD
jgi:hypothetical protein